MTRPRDRLGIGTLQDGSLQCSGLVTSMYIELLFNPFRSTLNSFTAVCVNQDPAFVAMWKEQLAKEGREWIEPIPDCT